MTDTPQVVAIAAGVDPADVQRLVGRITQLEEMLREAAERHTAEIETERQEHASIVGDLEAQRDAAIQRAEIAEKALRVEQQAEAQVEDGA